MGVFLNKRYIFGVVIILALLINPMYSGSLVFADEVGCGEWEVTESYVSEYRIEVVKISENETNTCEITLQIENTTEHFFFGEHGLSYQIETQNDNINQSFVYSKDATLILDDVTPFTETGYLVPGNYLFRDQPVEVTFSPSDKLLRGDAWISFNKTKDARAFDLAYILTDLILGELPGIEEIPACVLPDSGKMVFAAQIADKHYQTFRQLILGDLSIDFFSVHENIMTELQDYYSILGRGFDCGFETAEKLFPLLVFRQLVGWLMVTGVEEQADVIFFRSEPQIHIKYVSPIDEFAQLAFIEDGTIYLMRLGSTPVIAYPDPSSEYLNFDLSPDGRLIAAVREKSKEEGYGYEMSVINRLTKDVVFKGTGGSFKEFHQYEIPVKWSPDSTLFLFNKTVVSSSGAALKDIAPEEYITYTDLNWMSGSQSVIYMKERQDFQGLELFRYNVLFGLVEKLGVFPTDGFGYCAHLYDPVTEWVAALGGCVEGQATLAMLNPNGEIRVINQGNHIVFRGLFTGEWSPQGGKFVYTVGRPYAKASIKIYDAETNTEFTLPK
jgi:hypothetical protein